MTNSLIIGVDIGGTRTKSGLVNIATGNVLHTIVQPTEKRNADVFIRQVERSISEFKAIAAKEKYSVNGIGFGIPGFTGDGNVLTTYGFLEFMENYPLVKQIICFQKLWTCR